MLTLIVDRDAPGLTVVDDWDGMGQRTTGSGTIILDGVRAPQSHAFFARNRRPDALKASAGPFIIHAAIDLGIAEGALAAAVDYIKTRSKPYRGGSFERATDDPLIVSGIGALTARLHGAELLVERAAPKVDAAISAPSPAAADAASIAISEARIATTEIALDASTQLFQFAGTSSTRTRYGFDRFWRDARTHTTHDPVHWHVHGIGDYVLNGRGPKF